MDDNHRRKREARALIAMLAVMGNCPLASADDVVGRYSVMRDLSVVHEDAFDAPIDRHFDDDVITVGDAVRALLAGSGFELSATETAPVERATALAMAIPETQRRLRASSLRRALQVLVGSTLALVIDWPHHLVSFEPCVPAAAEARGQETKPQ